MTRHGLVAPRAEHPLTAIVDRTERTADPRRFSRHRRS